MKKFFHVNMDIPHEQIQEAIAKEIANRLPWEMRKRIEDAVVKAVGALDQATINRMVTEFLVAEHLGKLKVKDEQETR